MTVERTIGVLKNLFRCIFLLGARQLHYRTEKVAKIVNVCCALHNLWLQLNVPMHDEYFEPIDDNHTIDHIVEGDIDISADNIWREIMSSIL